ncbi:MAG: hypothetical protein WCA30_06745 [Dermatophilaceae bacterium]
MPIGEVGFLKHRDGAVQTRDHLRQVIGRSGHAGLIVSLDLWTSI